MTIVVNFEDLEPGTTVTNQFESKGIVFNSPNVVVRDPDTSAHFLQPRRESNVSQLLTRVIRGRFVEPKHSRISVAARLSNPGQDGIHAVLRIFDVNGHPIDSRSFGSTGLIAKTDIESPAANIASFEITSRANSWDELEWVAFDQSAAADFRVVYNSLTEPLILRPGCAATARLNFYRLHGSHGEIILSVVKPCPDTTWCFNPPVVHSGVAHTNLEIWAKEDASPAYHFSIQVVAVPRQKTAGRHEHEVTIPVSISGLTPNTSDEDKSSNASSGEMDRAKMET